MGGTIRVSVEVKTRTPYSVFNKEQIWREAIVGLHYTAFFCCLRTGCTLYAMTYESMPLKFPLTSAISSCTLSLEPILHGGTKGRIDFVIASKIQPR
jgi:hypothetical protein